MKLYEDPHTRWVDETKNAHGSKVYVKSTGEWILRSVWVLENPRYFHVHKPYFSKEEAAQIQDVIAEIKNSKGSGVEEASLAVSKQKH